MTYGGNNDGHFSTSERREAARAKAREIRELKRKKDRRGKAFLFFGVVGGTLGVLALAGFLVMDSIKPARPGPLNMLSDGIKLTEQYEVVKTAALSPEANPVPNDVGLEVGVVDIQIYIDYFAANSKLFTETNNSQLEAWLEGGAATVEIRPISILNPNSQGTQYSTRSANAAACVANFSPDSYWAVNNALLANQPEERTPGLSDDELHAIVIAAGATRASAIENCIRSQAFKPWVGAATLRALEGPLPGFRGDAKSDENKVRGTPTVLVNGLLYKGPYDDPDAFAAFVVQAAGAIFNETTTSAPTPTPTPTETPTPTRTPRR